MKVPTFRFPVSSCITLLLLVAAAVAQQQAPTPAQVTSSEKPVTSELLKQLVANEFGPTFEMLEFDPLFMDIDGDGAEDAVIVATSKNPLLDMNELHFKVIDPYDSYFGIGDPKITAGFAPTQLGPPRYLLVLHNWRAAPPKAKFVIINLPFEKLSAGRTLHKKKAIAAIQAEESGGLVSAVFWDGKKYKWEPAFIGQ